MIYFPASPWLRSRVPTMSTPTSRSRHSRSGSSTLGVRPTRRTGRKTVGKGGIVSGFLSAVILAPDDGIGVVVFSNTGGLDGRGASEPLAAALLRRLLGLPDQAIRTDIPARPETWHEICGWYSPDPGPVTNLFLRAPMGAGAEVMVRGNLSHTSTGPAAPGAQRFPAGPNDASPGSRSSHPAGSRGPAAAGRGRRTPARWRCSGRWCRCTGSRAR